MTKKYRNREIVTSCLEYHIVWTTKFARSVIEPEMHACLKNAIMAGARKLGCTIRVINVLKNWIYIHVGATPEVSPNQIVKAIKRQTSIDMTAQFPEIRSRLPCIWTRNYMITGSPNIAHQEIIDYVTSQKTK